MAMELNVTPPSNGLDGQISMVTNDGTTEEMLQALRRHFGFENFRPLQAQACHAAIAEPRRDLMIVIPTGGGKTLCYVLPALLAPEPFAVTVVVSPLIALARDQLEQINKMEEPVGAAAWNSSTLEEHTSIEGRLLAQARAPKQLDSGGVHQCSMEEATVLHDCDREEDEEHAQNEYDFEVGHKPLRLLFTTPEQITARQGKGRLPSILGKLVAARRLHTLVVDEAHVVTGWGTQFRSKYLELAKVREDWGGSSIVPIHALTASLPPGVGEERLFLALGLENPIVQRGSINRPEIKYVVRRRELLPRASCGSSAAASALMAPYPDGGDRQELFDTGTSHKNSTCGTDTFAPCKVGPDVVDTCMSGNTESSNSANTAAALQDLFELIRTHMESGAGIVYCRRRETCEWLAGAINESGILACKGDAYPYHAGLGAKERHRAEGEFLHSTADVVVATIAFGLGIDKPGVRYVAHWNVPKGLSALYQESGRCGRDGCPALHVLYHSKWDFDAACSFAHDSLPDMFAYIENEHDSRSPCGGCRRAELFKYFGETPRRCCTAASVESSAVVQARTKDERECDVCERLRMRPPASPARITSSATVPATSAVPAKAVVLGACRPAGTMLLARRGTAPGCVTRPFVKPRRAEALTPSKLPSNAPTGPQSASAVMGLDSTADDSKLPTKRPRCNLQGLRSARSGFS